MEEQPRRRRRPALSCLACRRRKLKCDRANPCARCVSANVNCTYRGHGDKTVVVRANPEPDSEGPVTLSPSASFHTRTQVIDSEISNAARGQYPSAPSVRAATTVAAQSGYSDIPQHHGTRNPSHDQEATSELRDIRERVRKLEELSASSSVHGLVETGRHILTRQAGLQDSEIMLKKTRLLRWSDWMATAPEFQFIFKCFEAACGGGGDEKTSFQSDEAKALIIEMDDLYRKCKRIARSIKVNRPSRCLSSPRPSLEPPSRETADMMAAAYFRCFEPPHRIFHEPSFWAEYRNFWEAPESSTTAQRLKVLLVVAIGSSIREEAGPDSELRSRVQQWIYTAQAWLSGPLEKDRLDIQGLQIHTLAMLARQIFSIGGDLVWTSMGSLLHRAMQIGLHRDPEHLPSMSLLQAEVRRRLWYTIIELLVQSSLDSAMPPRISFEDFDTKHPSNNNDDEIDESTTALLPHPRGSYTSTSIQLLLIESLSTRLQTVQLLNGLHSELAYQDVLSLSSEITRFCKACNQFATENRQAGVTAFQRNMCDFLVRRFLIPLHCPFASEAPQNPLFHYSRKVVLDAALAFISPEPDGYFARLMATGGGMYREGFRYATSAITLELLVQAQTQRDDGTYWVNTDQLNFLRGAIDNITALAWERVRQGETNIKGPMFLGIVLIVANSANKDSLCEFMMVKNARESLTLCHHILETRAKAISLLSPNGGSLASSSLDIEPDGFGFDFGLDFLSPNGSGW